MMPTLWFVCTLMGQTTIDPPLTGRPPAFSNIVGQYDEPRVEAAPTEVAVEEPITLRITITGAGPAQYEPASEHLRLFPQSWERDFYVEELPDLHVADRTRKTWVFAYRLRPRHTRVQAISDIKLVYYNPASSEKNKFETHYAESIPITVTPAREAVVELGKRVLPDSFYVPAPVDLDQARLTLSPSWAALLALAPIACLFGACARRRFYPGDAKRQSAEQAIARLQPPEEGADDIFCRYLRDRFDIVLEQPTPAEVEGALLRRGFARELARRSRELMQAGDARRYAGVAAAINTNAAEIIAALEADPCVR